LKLKLEGLEEIYYFYPPPDFQINQTELQQTSMYIFVIWMLKERVQGTCSNPNERYVNEKGLER